MEVAVGEFLDDHFALGHEKAGPAHEVPLSYVPINFDTRVLKVVNFNQIGHRLAPSAQRSSLPTRRPGAIESRTP